MIGEIIGEVILIGFSIAGIVAVVVPTDLCEAVFLVSMVSALLLWWGFKRIVAYVFLAVDVVGLTIFAWSALG